MRSSAVSAACAETGGRRDVSTSWLEKGGVEVNGKSIMGVLMLAAEMGSQLVIRGKGADAKDAVAALGDLVASGFEETKDAKEIEDV